MTPDWPAIARHINQATDQQLTLSHPQPIGGGCINDAWKVCDQHQKYWFVKINKPCHVDMFAAEMEGLQEIIKTRAIRAPQPVCYGQSKSHAFLVMEYLSLRGSPDGRLTGKQLAGMHQQNQSIFGWNRDNTIGSTPQKNTPDTNWANFWRVQRLEYQLNLALKKGFPHRHFDQGMILAEATSQFFTDYQPFASLLHGDLWGGNCSADHQGNPVIYDPATYYGDRETDLAMTELFGGFGMYFKASYHDILPIDPGYTTRKTLYNLYHILNHYNLFGGGYATQAATMIDSLLSELQG